MTSGRSNVLRYVLCCCALIVPNVAAAFGLPELMSSLARVEASRAEFTETKTLALLAKPLVLTGRLLYKRPDSLERQTLTPVEERMVVVGSELTLENVTKKQKRTFSLKASPVMWAFVESIRASLAGDQKTLERFYWVKFQGKATEWVVNLEPRDAAMSEYVQLIRLSGAQDRIERIEVFEKNGDRSDMVIKPL
jgi:outer membrane lipoprotein-sorting protein